MISGTPSVNLSHFFSALSPNNTKFSNRRILYLEGRLVFPFYSLQHFLWEWDVFHDMEKCKGCLSIISWLYSLKLEVYCRPFTSPPPLHKHLVISEFQSIPLKSKNPSCRCPLDSVQWRRSPSLPPPPGWPAENGGGGGLSGGKGCS